MTMAPSQIEEPSPLLISKYVGKPCLQLLLNNLKRRPEHSLRGRGAGRFAKRVLPLSPAATLVIAQAEPVTEGRGRLDARSGWLVGAESEYPLVRPMLQLEGDAQPWGGVCASSPRHWPARHHRQTLLFH